MLVTPRLGLKMRKLMIGNGATAAHITGCGS